MVELQIDSVESPLSSADAVALALALVSRAQTMGFLPARGEERLRLDRSLLRELAESLRGRGVASIAATRLLRALRTKRVDQRALVQALRATIDAVDASPHPSGEWEPARELLGDELLARLLGVSASSLRRYAGEERHTPDAVAWRLHTVARVLASLVGSYNDYGIRRWFERRRTALDGASPAEVLEAAGAEDDERLERVVALADALTGAGAAA